MASGDCTGKRATTALAINMAPSKPSMVWNYNPQGAIPASV